MIKSSFLASIQKKLHVLKYFNFPIFPIIPSADLKFSRPDAANAFGDTLSGAGLDVGS